MAFRGLFIGIDRYASADINWLGCARRDAVAMHALFADTLGSGGTLLIDEQATRSAIDHEIQGLAGCSPEDVVVVVYSGHGSNTHELVTYDADPHQLPTTGIPLDAFATWLATIPARRLVCILDCCFSGGMGAKVLHVDVVPKSLASVASLLDQMKGEGRLILTASDATEPAYEHAHLGHGFLTYYLLEALKGAEEVRKGGKLSVYRLLEFVTQRVIDAAAQIGRPQHPTLRGELDGEWTWPVFTPGDKFHAAFPEYAIAPVTPDIQSLAAHGFPPDLLHAWAETIPGLNPLQLDAINDYHLLQGGHLVVSAPTSSGKTMIGELAALKGALDRKRTLFLLPLKALVNDKQQQFQRTYGAFGVRVLRATGDYTADNVALLRGQYDLCLMTYEKFANLVLVAPHLLNQVGTIVIDEVQMIADESRGANLEFVLTLLRLRRRQGEEPQLIALSAVIGDTNGLERWLGARLLRRTERPVPLDEGMLLGDGTFWYLDPAGQEHQEAGHVQRLWGEGKSRDWVIPLVRKLVAEGKQVIVFRETKSEARFCAQYLAESLGLAPAEEALALLPTGDPSNASHALRQSLAGGVAFHVADLAPTERTVIEAQFRSPQATLRVIAATTTLAMGVNTPVSAVIIVGLEHPLSKPYSIAEYKNMVGRAGRLGHAERGTSYLLALTAHDSQRLWSHYVLGKPEDLCSHFLAADTDPRSLLLRVFVAARVSTVKGLSAEEAVGFLEESFGAFQQRQVADNWQYDREQLFRALADLEMHRLVERDGYGGYRLTELGQVAGESGMQVESVIRVVDAIREARPEEINIATLITTTQLTVELDDVPFPMNKKSTLKEPQMWVSELRGQGVPEGVLQSLHHSVPERYVGTLRAKKSVACLLWITNRPLLEVEQILTQFGGSPGGAAGAILAVSSRTYDIIPTVARMAELLHVGLDLGGKVRNLLVRLDVGVPSSIVEIAEYTGNRLGRGDYQSLVRAGLTTVDAIATGTNEQLLACVDQSAEKLEALRQAVELHERKVQKSSISGPLLPPPED